ncbi:beta-ketoacyl-acyl-carrier-protein synthase II [Polytolypa hystricis UAMH7299]|uniref:beta-ketoacyl-[acyl-carrier-protein] synthase I n=1 Tax=Polytolypa hystricis (strain UAMH7299) TaxID=1447883 RepID=A0A2B7WGB3_POLH7|nr:beta-ketoacyl-acyl-carrier-protein synthase II [Polytolypa hystricis UAMH7299]
MRRVVVTGLGAVTPLGLGIRRTWKRLLDGHCGIISVKHRDPRFSEVPCQIAAVVPQGSRHEGGWNPADWLTRDEERKTAKFTQYALAATEEALVDADWKPSTPEQKEMTGICLGSGIGNFDEMFDTTLAYSNGGYKKISPLFVPRLLINLGAGHISMKYGFTGPNHAATTACTTGAHSIGDASRFIAYGDADVMIAGGAESCIHPLVLGGFSRCRSLATAYNDAPTEASRPFDRDRQGFIVGEGAAMVVLEELEHAKSRGARIYAELKGYGCSGDAHHMTAPKESGEGALSAMRRALKNAKLAPKRVDYINAHGTSTVIGDAAENTAIKKLLLGEEGKQRAADVNVSSTKGAIGHLLGGAGAIEAVFSILALHENVLPPTINLDNLTEGFDCNYVPKVAQQRPVDVQFVFCEIQFMKTSCMDFDMGSLSYFKWCIIALLVLYSCDITFGFSDMMSSMYLFACFPAGTSSVASSSGASFVDASGYKFSEKDQKPVKIKVKKSAGKNAKGAAAADSRDESQSPILPEMDEKTMAAFPTGKPRETQLETVICKHCKRPVLKQTAPDHIKGCLKAKQEKARKKKEARDKAKEKAADKDKDKDGNERGDDAPALVEEGAMKGQKSAKKSAGGEDGPKKGKKRKADDEDKEPKKKKKKDEPKPKVPKPKGPVDVEKQCGVPLPNGGMCARSLTCKSHSMGAKRAVPGRSLPYDMLFQAYQKKNKARQQKAAIDANAPIHDDIEGSGPIDSDEEKDAVMAGFVRSRPQPLVTHPLIPTRRKYHLVRMKEMLSQVLGGARGGLFTSTDLSGGGQTMGRNFLQSDSSPFASPVTASAPDGALPSPGVSKKALPSQQAAQHRPASTAPAAAGVKKTAAAQAAS